MARRFRFPRSFSDYVLDDAVEYFSTAFNDAPGTACPGPEVLRRLAASPDLVSGEIRTHLFQCSRCFLEFRHERLAILRGKRGASIQARLRAGSRVAWIAAAASLILTTGAFFAWYYAGGRSPLPPVRQIEPRDTALRTQISFPPVVIAVRLPASGVTRGEAIGTEPKPSRILVPAAPLRMVIDLPDGYPDAVYETAIVTPFDEVLARTVGYSAAHRLTAMLDGSHLKAGPHFLRVGRAGHPPDYVPIDVLRR